MMKSIAFLLSINDIDAKSAVKRTIPNIGRTFATRSLRGEKAAIPTRGVPGVNPNFAYVDALTARRVDLRRSLNTNPKVAADAASKDTKGAETLRNEADARFLRKTAEAAQKSAPTKKSSVLPKLIAGAAILGGVAAAMPMDVKKQFDKDVKSFIAQFNGMAGKPMDDAAMGAQYGADNSHAKKIVSGESQWFSLPNAAAFPPRGGDSWWKSNPGAPATVAHKSPAAADNSVIDAANVEHKKLRGERD